MAQYDDDTPPEGYRWQYFGDPSRDQASGRYPVPIETPTGEGSGRPIAPHREVAGEVPGTGPSLDQMRFELAQQQPMQDPQSKSLRDTLMNLPLEIRDQAMALGEVGASIFGSMVSPVVGAAAGVGKNLYDYVDKGKIDPAATKDFANTAAGYASYVPTIPSAQHIMQLLGEAPAYFMGTGQGLPPIVSGINPRALQAPRGTTGALTAGVKRDVKQFDNDVFNAQRGITPGYATLGSEFSDAFVTPRPTVYEMLAGLEPSNVPSTASAAVKPKGKGTWVQELSTRNLGELQTWNSHLAVPQLIALNKLPEASYDILRHYLDTVLKDQPLSTKTGLFAHAGRNFQRAKTSPQVFTSADEYISGVNKTIEETNKTLPVAEQKPLLMLPSAFLEINNAHSQWLEGPGLKYVMTQMGTGLKHDPLLKDIEARDWNFMGGDRTDWQHEADLIRAAAQDVHMLDPNYNPLTGDVGSVTTSTDAGRAYENLTDLLVKSMPKSELGPTRGVDLSKMSAEDVLAEYGYKLSSNIRHYLDDFIKKWDKAEDDNDMPKLDALAKEYLEQMQYLNTQPDLMKNYGIDASLTDSAFARTPEHTPVYNLPVEPGGLTNPFDVLSKRVFEALLKGDIDPSRISNVSVQRVANELWKDELARRAKVKEADVDYKNWKIEHKAAMPGDDLSDGSKMVIYDDTVEPDVLTRGLSADTWELDHCVADACIDARGDYKGRRYVPVMDPRTGKMVPRPDDSEELITRFIDSVIQGESRIASLYDKNNDIQATLELEPGDGPYREMGEDVTQIMGYHDKAVHPAAWPAIVEWLNKNADKIGTVLPSALEHVSPSGLMDIPEGVSPVRKLYPQYKDAGELTDFRELGDITESLPDADYTIDPHALDELFHFMSDTALRTIDDKFEAIYKPITGQDIPDSLQFLGPPDFDRIEQALGKNSPEYAAFEKLYDEANNIDMGAAFENQVGRFFRPNDVKAYAAANGIDLSPQPIDIATANESQLKYRSQYLDRAIKQLNLKYNNATDGATHQAITDDVNMIKYEQEAIAERLKTMTGKDVLGADRPVATYNSDQIAQLRQAVNQYLERGQFDTLQNYDLNLMVYPLLGLDDQNSQLPGNLHRQLVGMMLSPLTTVAEFKDMYTRAGQGALMGSVLDQDQIANAQHILSDWAIAHGHNIKPVGGRAQGGIIRMAEGGQASKEDEAALFADNIDQMRYELTKKNSGPVWDETGKQIDPNTGKPIQAPFQFDMANRSTVLPMKYRADADWQKSVMAKPEEKGWDWALPGMLASPINALSRGMRDPNVVDANEVAMTMIGGSLGLSHARPASAGSSGAVTKISHSPEYYHGSDVKGLTILDPAASMGRRSEGSSIWVTPDETFAAGYPKKQTGSIYTAPLSTSGFAKVDANFTSNRAISPDAMIYHSNGEVTPVSSLGQKVSTDQLAAYARSKGDLGLRIMNVGDMGSGQFAGIGPNPSMYGESVAVFNPLKVSGERNVSDVAKQYAAVENTKPLTEKQFYSRYSQHVDIRNRENQRGAETLKSIQESGWKPGFSVNTLPPYRGGTPTNVVDKKLAPRTGDYVYLVPNTFTTKTGNGLKINEGWTPKPYEAVRVTEDYPDMYKEYLKAFNAKAQGGAVRMADGGAVTDTLDKMVKNPQASTLLNLDLPNLIAAKQQVRAMKRGGKVEFSNNIDDMRYALTRR